MKFTQKQLIEFALKAGVPVVEVVAEDKDSDYNEDAALQDVHKAITPIIRPKIEAELTPTLETALKGKHAGETYSLLARESGLTRSELEKMSVADAAKHAFTHITTKLGGDTTALQQTIKDMDKKHADAIAKLTLEKDGEISVANQKYINRDIKTFLAENVVGKSPLLETADKGYYADLLLATLQNKYHLTYDEAKKSVSLFKKDNPAIPALNEAGTAVVDVSKEFEAIAKPAGVWKTDSRTTNPAEKMKQQQTDPAKANPQQTEGPRRGRQGRITPEQALEAMKALEEQ